MKRGTAGYPFSTAPWMGVLDSIKTLATQASEFYDEIGGQAVTTNVAKHGSDAMLEEVRDVRCRPGSVCTTCKELKWYKVGARVPAKCKCGGPLHPLEILYRR